VEYKPNPDFHPITNIGVPPTSIIVARKLIVVSCGACGTPSVLERSGIGNHKVLREASVPLIADVPGVGHDYQDHNLITYPYRTNLQIDQTIDQILSGRMDLDAIMAVKSPILGWNTVSACR
jgi:alcohol oxidase